jgi:hypothetical protein
MNANEIITKRSSSKVSNGEKIYLVTNTNRVLDFFRVDGDNVTELDAYGGDYGNYTLGVNVFKMRRIRQVITTEAWSVVE